MSASRQNLLLIVSFLSFVTIGLAVFRPALTGPFLLDDSIALNSLGDYGGITDLRSLRHYVFSGEMSTLGRPLSLLSFVLNEQTTPVDPAPFKYTNLLIHILNGLLIVALAIRLAKALGINPVHANFIALFCALLWLIHPPQINTVMYIVQRMTELMALFVLAGIMCYLHGRELLSKNDDSGLIWITLGVPIFLFLAVLCKENGTLLPLYILVIEKTLFANRPLQHKNKKYVNFVILTPVLLLSLALILRLPGFIEKYSFHDFTLSERLLTESRVLISYLGNIFSPRISNISLFHDDIVVSKSLTSPITTLTSIALLFGLLVSSLFYRKKYPLFSFGILWFFSGHIIESSFIPLELYFEHRNYLPSFGIIFSVCFIIYHLANKHLKNSNQILVLFFIPLIMVFGGITYQVSKIWGNEQLLLAKWSHDNPTSRRAQIAFSEYLTHQIQAPIDAHEVLLKYHLVDPDDITVNLNILYNLCLINKVSEEAKQHLLESGNYTVYNKLLVPTISVTFDLIESGQCIHLDYNDLLYVIERSINNKKLIGHKYYAARLYYLKSMIHTKKGDLDATMDALQKSIELQPSVSLALVQAYTLYTAGLYQEAMTFLSIARKIDDDRSFLIPSRMLEINSLESIIRKKMATNI